MCSGKMLHERNVVLIQTFKKLKGTLLGERVRMSAPAYDGQEGQVDEVPLKLTTFSYFQRLIQQNYHIRWGNLDTTFFFLEWGHRRQSCRVGGVATPQSLGWEVEGCHRGDREILLLSYHVQELCSKVVIFEEIE